MLSILRLDGRVMPSRRWSSSSKSWAWGRSGPTLSQPDRFSGSKPGWGREPPRGTGPIRGEQDRHADDCLRVADHVGQGRLGEVQAELLGALFPPLCELVIQERSLGDAFVSIVEAAPVAEGRCRRASRWWRRAALRSSGRDATMNCFWLSEFGVGIDGVRWIGDPAGVGQTGGSFGDGGSPPLGRQVTVNRGTAGSVTPLAVPGRLQSGLACRVSGGTGC